MNLITSAAYITPGLIAEFGKLPPSMLPVQNKRLYQHQFALFNDKTNQVLSLPKSFKLGSFDKKILSELCVHVVYVPDGLSLGQSIIYVLNVMGCYDEPINILHGDTLFEYLPNECDIYTIAQTDIDYSWGKTDNNKDVYSGYFSFSSQSLLLQKIIEANYDFIKGVESYRKTRHITKVKLNHWMDFGIANSYYRSISQMTTQRSFNNLKVNNYSLKKYSTDSRKILAEANWFTSLPKGMKHYAPSLWDSGIEGDKGFYEIEYFYLSSLANLFIFARNPQFVWDDILASCAEFINNSFNYHPDNKTDIACQNNQLYLPKTIERLKIFSAESGISLDNEWTINGTTVPSLLSIANETSAMIQSDAKQFVTLMHGDFCFSNILYDFKSKSIRVIDPRGIDLYGNYSIYGDLRYDVAKLAHSAIGKYDLIIAGRFNYRQVTDYNIEFHLEKNETYDYVQNSFCKLVFAEYSIEELSTYPIMVHLFLSMLPLHADNPLRQKAMLANALLIYTELKKTNK